MILVFYLMWFIRVFSYLVWFMVVMVIPPISSSKQAWPALGGSTEEQSKNLVKHLILTDSEIHNETEQKPGQK